MKLRFSSAYCIDEASSNYNNDFQKKYCNEVIPLLLNSLLNENSFRVKCQLLNALINFISYIEEKEIISPYLKNIFESLFKLFNNSDNIGENFSVPKISFNLSIIDNTYLMLSSLIIGTFLYAL